MYLFCNLFLATFYLLASFIFCLYNWAIYTAHRDHIYLLYAVAQASGLGLGF
jgi:hypothetical protein